MPPLTLILPEILLPAAAISSNLTLPLYTSYIKFTAFNNWPPYYPPLHPIAIAISFLLFKISDLAIVITSGFFYIATIPILFVLAKRLIDEKVATLASLRQSSHIVRNKIGF